MTEALATPATPHRTVLITNALAYTGPGAVPALLARGMRVACHDPAFADSAARERAQSHWPEALLLHETDPVAAAAEATASFGDLEAVVSNDVYPLSPRPIESLDLDDLRRTFEAVTVTPIRLAQAVLPTMKQRRRGAMVFVTSARERKPELGYAVPTTARAATTAFAKALAREAAPYQVQVTVVAPNYLESELYYPRARFVDDPVGRAEIAGLVPFGRLGTPAEVGALIAFLASGTAPFVTGQVIDFTGGWP